jgi:erythromycin esterase-like protein
MSGSNRLQADTIVRAARPLTGGGGDFDPLIDAIADDTRLVLLGEASHGTDEFYRCRAQVTQQLIEDRGFTAVIAEADWPDAYRVNRYVRGARDDADADAALRGFERFPTWMWRNRVVLEFVEWLRLRNEAVPRGTPKCGFYGMDLYSLHNSIYEVLQYLKNVDPGAYERARHRYACFEHFGEDPQAYGYAAGFDLGETCEEHVVEQLRELQHKAAEYAKRDGQCAEDEYFYAEQNARLVENAEEYYRTMFHGHVSSWNLRDQHMVETIDALLKHLDRHHGTGKTKAVVWAHNSHLGDARATEMGGGRGEWNVGQLGRERWGDQVFNVGFTTHTGTVTAASDWDAPAERKNVRPSLPKSYERLLHDVAGRLGAANFLLNLRGNAPPRDVLAGPLLERAIGVIYLPQSERISHYFEANLSEQFDAVIHFDETRAVEPLEVVPTWHSVEVPETYPSGV